MRDVNPSPEAVYAPAARRALLAFGVEPGELRFINLSENVTFKVTDRRDGSPLVLRLHRPGYHDLAALRSEHVWTRALVAAGIAAPDPLQTPTGEDFTQVVVEAKGERRWAGLARWVEGEMLADIIAREPDQTVRSGYYVRLGAMMAAMHQQATRWTPASGFKRQALDADGLMGAAPFWGPFWDHAIFTATERRLLLATRDKLHAALTRYGRRPQVFSLMHADLHPRNVLINGRHAAVIDFDDAGFGWHQYDLAVALVACQCTPDFTAYRDACIAGYRSTRTIPDEDLALLPMFLLIRNLAQIGWYHQRPELDASGKLPWLKQRVCSLAATFEPLC